LFRRLNDVANLWYRWGTTTVDASRRVSTDFKGEETANVRGRGNRFLKDAAVRDTRHYETDQYADDKVWRMHHAYLKMFRKVRQFKENYRPGWDDREDTWKKYGAVLAKMIAADFDEDFPFRPMTLLQEKHFMSDHRSEWIEAMKVATMTEKKEALSVAVYFNNAGMESWLNLWQVFLLLRLGFHVTIVVPESPVLNKDVTDQDIRFMIPYMDAWIEKVYEGQAPPHYLTEALAPAGEKDAGAARLSIRAVRIDERRPETTAPDKGPRGSKSFPERVREDLELAVQSPGAYEESLRRNLVSLIKNYHFNVLTGELWYGYFAGLGDLYAAPLNAGQDRRASEKNPAEGSRYIGRNIADPEQGTVVGDDILIRKIRPEAAKFKGHVLGLHVHKNVRQTLDSWSEGGANGRQLGGAPDATLTYGSFDAHYFYPQSWRVSRAEFYYSGQVDMSEVMADPGLFDSMLEKFSDAGKFFFGLQEDRMPVIVHDSTREAREAAKGGITNRRSGGLTILSTGRRQGRSGCV
jgi:hypothetical protein